MKKILAIILTVFTVANLFCFCVPASAGTTDINDNLVVHYDFEGATQAEALKDKAPAGATKDDLSVALANGTTPSASTVTFDLENGTVKRGDIRAQLTATASEDILALTDKATVFLRFKLPTLDQNYPLLELKNTTDSTTQARFQTGGNASEMSFIGGYRTQTGYTGYTVSTTPMRVTENYINLAVTIDVKNTDNGDGTYTGKLSYYGSVGDINGNTTWYDTVLGTKTPVNNADSLAAAADEFAFSVLGYVSDAGKINMILDDVRIYNRVLSLDEVKSIRLNTLESVGVQCKIDGDTYSARFIGAIDALDASAVGFEITAKYNDGTEEVVSNMKTYTTTAVYTSIKAGTDTIDPEVEWNCKYIAVLPIDNIKNSYGDVTFTVTPITIVNGVQASGATQTYVINAGVEVK